MPCTTGPRLLTFELYGDQQYATRCGAHREKYRDVWTQNGGGSGKGPAPVPTDASQLSRGLPRGPDLPQRWVGEVVPPANPTMPNDPLQDLRHFDTADRYVRAASIRLTGRTLRRWCDENPYLADALGRMKLPGRDLFDTRTAAHFRELYIEADRRKSAELVRAEQAADRRLKPRRSDEQ